MDEMNFTGERFVPSLDSPEISYEHWHRYLYAAHLVQGKRVLDIACGEGYGASLLAKTAASVTGMDISQEAIAHAQASYRAENLKYQTGSVDAIPLPGHNIFDAVISFETIEHIRAEQQAAFIQEVRRLLVPGGLCVLSTPNKDVYSDQANYHNEFHVKEFYLPEFKDFLSGYFAHVRLLGQRIFPVSYLWDLDGRNLPMQEYCLEWNGKGFAPTGKDKSVLYILALCSDQPLVDYAASLLLDLSERMWRGKDPRIEYYLAAIRERDNFIGNLKYRVFEKDKKIKDLEMALQDKNQLTLAGAAVSGPGKSGFPEPLPATQKAILVSIIIPAFNHVEHTQQCCRTLIENTPDHLFEVIIVDNASTDDTEEFLQTLSGDVKVIRNPDNKGFVEACNQGARAATGNYLLFLNNDTAPQPGWLEALLAVMDSDPAIGAVGAKLIYPDGRLQEAGGLIFADASGWNFGRGDDPGKPMYNEGCEVDYCSGACLLVQQSAFKRYGGFDDRYAPAYYEDVDLCFGLRSLGYKVRYCPNARIIHFEGTTAGTELTSGYKKYQVINREKFAAKWKDALAQQELSPDCTRKPPVTADRSRLAPVSGEPSDVALNILVVDPTLPLYDRAAGSLRLFIILKLLRQAGCEITFIARNGLGHERYQQVLEAMGIRVFAYDPEKLALLGYMVDAEPLDLKAILSETKFQIAWLSFYHIAEQYVPDIRAYSPDTKIFIDTVDIHFLRETRQAELTQNTGLLHQAQETKKRELGIYAKADCLITVTAAEKEFLQTYLPEKSFAVIPTIHEGNSAVPGFDLRSGLLYVGNFNHPPNPDAVKFFCQDIFPSVQAAIPGIKLYVVGDNPPAVVKDMENESIIVTGYVAQVEPYLNMCRLSIAPLRFGAGMKGKIGESLAHGLPVVTTSIGAEGMDLIPEEHVLLADTPEAFTQAVVRLYTDKSLWTKLSQRGRLHIEQNFGTQAVALQLRDLLKIKPKKPSALTSIIILARNQWYFTRQCLESIYAHTHEAYELIIVDNHSTDQTGLELTSFQTRPAPAACKAFKILTSEKNLGFAGGNNLGLTAAQGDYVILLNNDVVVTSGWLTLLLACARRQPRSGLVGPMSNYATGPQRLTAVGYDLQTLEGLDAYVKRFTRERACMAKPCWRLAGFCLLIKRAVIDKLGGLDERFGLGNFEDEDYSLRVLLAGYEAWIAMDCYVHHYGSRTFIGDNLDYQQSLAANWTIFKTKWNLPRDLPYGGAYEPAGLSQASASQDFFYAYSSRGQKGTHV